MAVIETIIEWTLKWVSVPFVPHQSASITAFVFSSRGYIGRKNLGIGGVSE